jgi:hypothetical protein
MVQLRLTSIGNAVDVVGRIHNSIRSLEAANALEHLVFFSHDSTVSVDICTDLLDFARCVIRMPTTHITSDILIIGVKFRNSSNTSSRHFC